ncbi:MAG TPA: hypothetical protein VK666_26985 [Chryseolinea sp.]|nr:hypothetical protein [Chryseolinea sp.]
MKEFLMVAAGGMLISVCILLSALIYDRRGSFLQVLKWWGILIVGSFAGTAIAFGIGFGISMLIGRP